MTQLRTVLLSLACLLLYTGCPGGKPTPGKLVGPKVALPEQPDEFDDLAKAVGDQLRFSSELQRLQSRYAARPSSSMAMLGENAARYRMEVRIAGPRVVLDLADRHGRSDWQLVCWNDDGSGKLSQIGAAREEADGLVFEFEDVHKAIKVKLIARWVNGSYLLCSREVTLGGLDLSMDLEPGQTRWRLAGPWQPYRLVPQPAGPFTLAADSQANSQWQTSNYPAQAMVPALLAYGPISGAVLAAADQHAQDLSRDYELGFRVDNEYKEGELLELSYRYFDSTQDAYVQQHMVSGLPVRDSIALLPFELDGSGQSQDVLALGKTAISALGELSRQIWFVPKPTSTLPEGCIVSLEEWASSPAELDDTLRQVAGIWGATVNAVQLDDAKLGASGYGGAGAVEIGGAGLDPDQTRVLEAVSSRQILNLQRSQAYTVDVPSPFAKALVPWLLNSEADGGGARLDIRRADCAAWILRKHVNDLRNNPALHGYLLPRADLSLQEGKRGQAVVISQAQASVWLQQQLAESICEGQDGSAVAQEGQPCLATPAYASAYILDCGLKAADGSYRPEARLLLPLVHELFGTRGWLKAEDSGLAGLVLMTTPEAGGHVLSAELKQHAGFETLAANLELLRKYSRELELLYCFPARSAYAVPEGTPPQVGELIAVVSGEWRSTRAVWIAFLGTGGGVELNAQNELTVSWSSGSWTRKLPGGVWRIEHPSPQQVVSGDAVLVKFSPLPAPLAEGSDLG